VAAVHEEMDGHAQKHEGIRQDPHDMGLVLGPQKESGHTQKNEKPQTGWQRKNRLGRSLVRSSHIPPRAFAEMPRSARTVALAGLGLLFFDLADGHARTSFV
jgi:hypothetical protein